MVNDDEIRVEHELPAGGAEATVERRLPEAFLEQIGMFHDCGAVVHGIVGRDLVALACSQRRSEGGIAQEENRPVPRRRVWIVIDRTTYSRPMLEIGGVQALEPV